jgi:hypothetical protein
MKMQLMTLAAALIFTSALPAQKLDLKLDHLIPLAKEHTVIDMDGAQIRAALAAAGESAKGKLKAQAEGIEVLQVRTFEFDKEGAYQPKDIEDIRRQMDAKGWSKIVSVREKKESVDIYLSLKEGAMNGVAVLAVEPRELTVVHITGRLNAAELKAMVDSNIAYDLAELTNRKP